jgi:hypothetical protein
MISYVREKQHKKGLFDPELGSEAYLPRAPGCDAAASATFANLHALIAP